MPWHFPPDTSHVEEDVQSGPQRHCHQCRGSIHPSTEPPMLRPFPFLPLPYRPPTAFPQPSIITPTPRVLTHGLSTSDTINTNFSSHGRLRHLALDHSSFNLVTAMHETSPFFSSSMKNWRPFTSAPSPFCPITKRPLAPGHSTSVH